MHRTLVAALNVYNDLIMCSYRAKFYWRENVDMHAPLGVYTQGRKTQLQYCTACLIPDMLLTVNSIVKSLNSACKIIL